MRRLALTLAACLMLPGACRAADKLYLSRSLDLNFKAPGKVAVFDSRGDAPVSEETRRTSWILILPKRINLTLSIGNDNPDDRHYHVGVRIKDELAPTRKVEGWVTPNDVTKIFWLDAYRFQITMIRKDATLNSFVSAMIKVDVYVPEPRRTP